MDIIGKTAVITGASGKLGGKIALGLAGAGCDCVCHYHSNGGAAEEIAEQIRGMGRQAVAVQADLCRDAEIAGLFDLPGGFGELGVLVNSAAVFEKDDFGGDGVGWAQRMMGVNLTAAIVASEYFVEAVKGRFEGTDQAVGKIVNIADVAGVRPWGKYSVYSASKAGLIGATKAFAKEYGPWVCVNAVVPGIVDCGEDFSDEELTRQIGKVPMGRVGTVGEIVSAVEFLLGSDYVTGQVICVDGGRSL